ncbi:hypothetical protein V2J09_023822 [Rumex salicifolius]
METNNDGGGGRTKLICIVAAVVTVVALVVGGIFLWVAFSNSDSPIVKVQRLSIPKFDVDPDLKDDEVVMSAELELFLESINKNRMTSASLESMVMGMSWHEHGVEQLGQSSVESVKQVSGGSNVIQIRTHAEADVRNKKLLTKEDIKVDVALSGIVVFSYGPFTSDSYAFLIRCNGVSVSSKDIPCSSKLYSTKKEMLAAAPTAAPSSQPGVGNSGGLTSQSTSATADITISDQTVILDNGILAVTISKPNGYITGIRYNGVNNILDVINPEDDRGYWDVVWSPPGATKETKGLFDRLQCTTFRVIVDTDDQVEVSFTRVYDPAAKGTKMVPLDIDIRYVILRGESGVYSYAIFERKKYPGYALANARLAFKLSRTKFRYLAINDFRQRKMPLPEDRMKGRGERLAYPEAVILTNPIDPEFKGEVDDKYQYSDESHDIKVHGFHSKDPPMGFWQITPSYEFRIGGPNKQFLTSHVGPSVLAMFVSSHYSGETVIPNFEDGEPWKKVFGPVFMYLNRMEKGQNASLLWEDAKAKMQEEANAWPYYFPASVDFPKANHRANVTGRFFVKDRFVNSNNIPADGAFIGLSSPGPPGSWQTECKGYQFWTNTISDGRFVIDHVRPGSYDLFAWVPGFIGDFRYKSTINITIGHNIDLGEIVYEPPRDGPTVWEIGEPERTAKEFFVPDPDPKYVNKLYWKHNEKFRQYGLWERYAEIYPTEDLIYTVNQSDYRKDWFFAHVTRKIEGRYNGTTWQIRFKLENVEEGLYKMRLAIAGASNANLEIRVNEPSPSEPVFIAGNMGNDNVIARHGIHGIYWLFNIDIQDNMFKQGENTIFLTQTKRSSPFQGVLYDYIRLEAPTRVAPQ